MTAGLSTVCTWGRMIKFSHSIFALPFAVMSAFLAGRQIPDRHLPFAGQLLLVVVCMVAARSAAMTFNRIVDARIDAANPRTAGRAIPRGEITPQAATAFLVGAAIIFLAGCAGFRLGYGNPWPLILGGPTLVYICGYSYTKRFTRLSHFYLGAAIALSPPAAWVAIHPASLGWPAIILMVAVTLWIAGFDIIYACQDIEVDREQGLFSLPSRLGPGPAIWIARACHIGTAGLLLTLGHVSRLGWLYFTGVAIVAILLLIENSLVRPGDYTKVNLAFFTVNGVVSMLMGTLAVADIVLNLHPVLG